MSKDIKFKKMDNIVNQDYISKINDIAGKKVKNVTIEANLIDFKIFELEETIIVVLKFEDSSGRIDALLVGNRDQEDKKIINSLIKHNHYRIRGTVITLTEEYLEELNPLFESTNPLKDYIKEDKLLCINALQNIEKSYEQLESIKSSDVKLFGYEISTMYDLNLEDSYKIIGTNTDYLKNIAFDEIKDIKFSYFKDIFILLNDGTLLVNGKNKINNINSLGFMSGINVFAFSNENLIIPLTTITNNSKFINNNDYKYKKIIITPLMIVALTYERSIKFFGMVVDGTIDYTKFYDVDDIGYYEDEDDIVVLKDKEIISLFNCENYTKNIKNIYFNGKYKETIILSVKN